MPYPGSVVPLAMFSFNILHQLLWGNAELQLQRCQPQLDSNVSHHNFITIESNVSHQQFHNFNNKILLVSYHNWWMCQLWKYYISHSKYRISKSNCTGCGCHTRWIKDIIFTFKILHFQISLLIFQNTTFSNALHFTGHGCHSRWRSTWTRQRLRALTIGDSSFILTNSFVKLCYLSLYFYSTSWTPPGFTPGPSSLSRGGRGAPPTFWPPPQVDGSL